MVSGCGVSSLDAPVDGGDGFEGAVDGHTVVSGMVSEDVESVFERLLPLLPEGSKPFGRLDMSWCDLLHLYLDYSPSQIAERLGVSATRVRVAGEKLRRVLYLGRWTKFFGFFRVLSFFDPKNGVYCG